MGRFVHEGAAIDSETGIVYLTEDTGAAGLYRFIPREPGNLVAGGSLEMLAVTGQRDYDTRTGQQGGIELPVHWVAIDEPDPPEAETNLQAVFNQGRALGGAVFYGLDS